MVANKHGRVGVRQKPKTHAQEARRQRRKLQRQGRLNISRAPSLRRSRAKKTDTKVPTLQEFAEEMVGPLAEGQKRTLEKVAAEPKQGKAFVRDQEVGDEHTPWPALSGYTPEMGTDYNDRPGKWFTTKEAAKATGMSEGFIKDHAIALGGVKHGLRWRFDAETLDAQMDESE